MLVSWKQKHPTVFPHLQQRQIWLVGIVTDHVKHRHLWGETKAAAPITLIAEKLF